MNKSIKIGLFGFGVVGQGLYNVLNQTTSINATIHRICVKDKSKSRNVDSNLITFNKNEILGNPDIDIIVELIDNADEAYEIVKTALKNKKSVVSANKKMIAEHLEEFYELQKEHGVSLLYEGAACGSIPIIRNLEEYYDNDLLTSIETICNGTTNYILTKMSEEGLEYSEALAGAQKSGFAESNPRLDVMAFDAKYKITILLAHSFGLFVHEKDVFHSGISNVSNFDFQYAAKNNASIKLIAGAYKKDNMVKAYVIPKFIPDSNMFYNVKNEFNAVQLEAAFSDKQFFYGKGAGAFPTASAVLADISALNYQYKYEYKKHFSDTSLSFSNDVALNVYIRYKEKSQLEKLEFESIDEQHTINQTNYIIAKVKLKSLIENNVNEWKDFFIAAL